MVLVAVTPGTPEASDVAELLSWPDPVGVTIRSALTAWSALLVADRDTEAPNTDIAATRARAVPAMNRRRSEAAGPDRRSSSAATGGMRTAPRAGPSAATTVTPAPTSSPTIAVRRSEE